MLCRTCDVILFAVELAQPEVQNRHPGNRGIAVLYRELQRTLVPPSGLLKAAARLEEVRIVGSGTQSEDNVAGLLETGDAFRVERLRRLEVAAGPVRESQQR